MRTNFGKKLICFGLLLIVAALSLSIYNINESQKAGEESERIISKLHGEIVNTEMKSVYDMFSGVDMPTKQIDGEMYIGIVEIPSLDLELPVLSEWDEEKSKKSVCRYSGSAYNEDMIIAGHNYRTHFSKITELPREAEVIFKDIDGNRFVYEVMDIEKIAGNDVEAMKAGEWSLTLFTCDFSGNNRITVRCIEKN